MLSRALSSATVTLLIGGLAVIPAQAQNLEAGKSPSQIFAGTCNACHKSPRGLLKTVPAGSLPGFLRQHYTTSSEMAGLLSGFLVSNGAADTRYIGTPPKAAKDAKPEGRTASPPEQLDRFGRRLRPSAPPPQEAAQPQGEPQQAVKPDTDGITRQGRKRLARPGEAPDASRPAADGQVPAQTASDRGPDGRKLTAKQRLSKRGKAGGEEASKLDAAKTEAAKPEAAKEEPAKDAAANTPKSETAKDEGGKPEAAKPLGEGKAEGEAESAKIDGPKETGSETPPLRADPVPPVTPAPPSSPAAAAAVSNGVPEPASPPAAPAAPAVTAAAPSPVAPAGPPAPPISQ